MSKETKRWKDVTGYEGLYQVSEDGDVFSKARKTHLHPSTSTNGYRVVCLYKEGKYKLHAVHRMVATAFLPNPSNLPIVNHKDADKQNNSVKNLEWVTQKENVAHAVKNRLHPKWRNGPREGATGIDVTDD
jgi:hypothetical protein